MKLEIHFNQTSADFFFSDDYGYSCFHAFEIPHGTYELVTRTDETGTVYALHITGDYFIVFGLTAELADFFNQELAEFQSHQCEVAYD